MNKKTTFSLPVLVFAAVLVTFGILTFVAQGRTVDEKKAKARAEFRLSKPRSAEVMDKKLPGGALEDEKSDEQKSNPKSSDSDKTKIPPRIKEMGRPSLEFNPIPAREVEKKVEKKDSKTKPDYSHVETEAQFSIEPEVKHPRNLKR